MLRPATPLSILLFASFVLLLISVISTPIVKGIPIARFQKVNFGVFGYCMDGGSCSGLKVGYTTENLFPPDQVDFNLPTQTRHSLSSLLIVHPIAAFCNLIVLGLAVAAHFHSPSHSARYLLGLLILLLPTLLVTLLAFLVDILLFVPHVSWGGWIVLASTILITASGVVTCAMRRTLVSRKARKRRIAENAEMSGENFYARQEQESKYAAVPSISTESKAPLVNGAPGANNLPAFADYDYRQRDGDTRRVNQPLQDDVPPVSPISEENRYYADRSAFRGQSRPADLATPSFPSNVDDPEGVYQPSQNGRGLENYPPNAYGRRGAYGPSRARGVPRGGFAPRGGFGQRGPPQWQAYNRGGYGPDARGAYNGRGRGGYPRGPVAAGAVGDILVADVDRTRGPPPPPGYPPRNGEVSPVQYNAQPEFPLGQPKGTVASLNGKARQYEPGSPSQYSVTEENATTYVAYSQQTQSHSKPTSLYSRGQSPAGARKTPSPPPDMPLIGQAVEMGAQGAQESGYEPDSRGMNSSRHRQDLEERPWIEQPQEYIPPRTQWGDETIDASAPVHQAVTAANAVEKRPRGSSNASGSYYEDVDPRFAEHTDIVPALPQPQRHGNVHHSPIVQPMYNGQDPNTEVRNQLLPHTASYEELPVGARSPAESDGSHFTSVSQRGINPNWRPGHGGEFNNFGPKRPQQARQDMLLANNPDFELIPPPARFGGRGGRGGFRGNPMGGASGRMPPPSALAISGDSPYPGPTTMREI